MSSPATQVYQLAPSRLPRLGRVPDTLRLDISRLDISFGIRESGNQCPIACALKRALAALGLNVLTVDIDARVAEVWIRGEMPWGIRFLHDGSSFVRDFDEGRRVQPRTIVLERRAS